MGCKAYRTGDEMRCPSCHLIWDVKEEPPQCGLDKAARKHVEGRTVYDVQYQKNLRAANAYRPRYVR